MQVTKEGWLFTLQVGVSTCSMPSGLGHPFSWVFQ